jgi:hypothetical protein
MQHFYHGFLRGADGSDDGPIGSGRSEGRSVRYVPSVRDPPTRIRPSTRLPPGNPTKPAPEASREEDTGRRAPGSAGASAAAGELDESLLALTIFTNPPGTRFCREYVRKGIATETVWP